MATTKKTPAKKKAVKTAPKKQHEPVENRQEPATEQLQLPTKPEPVKPEEELVTYEIPVDKSLESNDQFWESNVNGINFRFPRGELLTHPRWLYDYVRSKLWLKEKVNPVVAEFRNTSKRLNY